MKKIFVLSGMCIMIILLSGLSHAAGTGSKEVKTDFTSGVVSTGVSNTGAANLQCTPQNYKYGTIPNKLYDFVVSSHDGMTSILGIARMPLAVGIKKDSFSVDDIDCHPIPPGRRVDMAYLKSLYGDKEINIVPQLKELPFLLSFYSIFNDMGTPKFHRRVIPSLVCVFKDLESCKEWEDYSVESIRGFDWIPPDEGSDLMSLSNLGITVDINPDENTINSDGNLPKCVVDSFKKFGWSWGGDYENNKAPGHFEFLGDPNLIQTKSQKGQVTQGNALTASLEAKDCELQIPEGTPNSEAVGGLGSSGSLVNGYPMPIKTEFARLTKLYYDGKPYRIDHHYGTTELVKGFYKAACLTHKKFNKVIGFGDLSLKNGGKISWVKPDGKKIYLHQTHTCGRDIDVWFYETNNEFGDGAGSASGTGSKKCDPDVPLNPNFDLAANWYFLKSFFEAVPTQRVLLDCSIIKHLKEYAMKNDPGSWEKYGGLLHHHGGHHHHFHITIKCPYDDKKCDGPRAPAPNNVVNTV